MKKKICFVITAEFVVKAFMLEHLKKLSSCYEVSLIVNTVNPNFLEEDGLEEIDVIPLSMDRNISLVSDIKNLFKLLQIFNTRKFDLVHSITPKAGLLAMLASFLTRVKHRIHTFQGEVWSNKSGPLRWLLIFMDWLVARLATHLTVVSATEREFLINHKILTSKKSRVLHNGSISGVNINKFKFNRDQRQEIRGLFSIQENDTVFLYLGRLNKDKGIIDLIEAFIQLNLNNCHLLIVGPDDDAIAHKIHDCYAGHKHIHLHHYTNQPQAFYSASDVICLPSYREGFGMVIIEAAAVGIPSIASDIYGIRDAVVNGQTGLLHKPRDINDIRDKLYKLATAPMLRAELGEHARSRAIKDFNASDITNAWLKFYAEIFSEFT